MEQRTLKKPLALHLFWPNLDLDLRPPEQARGKEKPKSLPEQAKERRAKLESMFEFFEGARAYAKARDAAAESKSALASDSPASSGSKGRPSLAGARPESRGRGLSRR